MPDSFYMETKNTPPVCDYEGSDYQTSFWDQGGREYEDRTEAIALKRLLPKNGRLMLELGAGAGRNSPRYAGYQQVVLLDYSTTQLQRAQERLGKSERYIFVAADVYRLPFVDGLFDGSTMIRTLHHMADAPKALSQVRRVLGPGATFILEFASKLNIKAILRYGLGKQDWSPFTREPVEFVALNFDFHPEAIRIWLRESGFRVEKTLTVSHFRLGQLKQLVPTGILVALDSLVQWTGSLWQLTPSVFMKASLGGERSGNIPDDVLLWFKCPVCDASPLIAEPGRLHCNSCSADWAIRDGIYDFKEPVTG